MKHSAIYRMPITTALCLTATVCTAAPWPGFECGMGIGGWLTNYKRFNVLPQERRLDLTDGDYAHFDSYITEGDIARIKRWGFDHIRLGFDQIVLEEKPGVYRDRTFKKIDDFIGWCGKHKINVVLNLHKAIGNYCDIPEKVQLLDDDALQRRFVNLWLEMERRYHDFPGLAFEILNEVRDVEPAKWNDLAERTIRTIRTINPDRWIVVGSICWNSANRLKDLKVWNDPKVVYTFHAYEPCSFTHQRGVLQAEQLYKNADVPYPGRERVLSFIHPAAEWAAAHPDKILWNGEFGTIRHANPIARVSYMRDIVSFCKCKGIPYCVWNYLSTPNDGNRFSLVDDDTRDFLSDALLDACLGRGDSATGGKLTILSFNLWGDYFGNPVCERDLKEAAFIRRNEPDIVCCQEATPSFWSSRIFTTLAPDYGVVRCEGHSEREFNPILYRQSRLELLESGTATFAAADNPEGSKGFSWGVFRDRATDRRFIACSTHLWWKQGTPEHDAVRVRNAKELLAHANTLKAKYGDLPLFVLGDMNTTQNDRKSGHATPLDEFAASGLADAQYSTPGASQWSSNHGDPKRDTRGNLRGWIRPEASDPANSLDHVFYTASAVEPLELVVDRSQDALECSDHSPVKFTFRLK